jgi:hippurate hydrolase
MQRLVTLRRALHRDPELSFEEHRTAERIEEMLAALRPTSIQRVAKTGVVARVTGKDPNAPAVAVRGDIDALPIQEATELEFASKNAGVMHACGHDVHAAWAMGAAMLLAKHPAEGDVLVVFQPAEEIGKGAVAVLESGALNGVKAIVGAHVDRRFPVGKVIVQEGPLAASTDTFEIDLVGKGAHGARPHEAADPIVAAAGVIAALQTVVARKLNPATAGVVSVGSVHAGSAPNVIPDRARLTGTLRAIDAETRALLKSEVVRIVTAVASGYGVEGTVTFDAGTPPIVNPPEPIAWAREAARSLLGDEAFAQLPGLNMVGEDFSYYMERMTGCFLRVGACEEGGKPIPSHSPHFYAAEEAIFVGAAVLAETARVASHKLRHRKDNRA